jgi:hypothetical protein
MLVLPAALVWAEQHGAFSLRDLDPRPFLAELRDAFGDLWARRPGLPRVPRPRLGRPRLGRPRLGRPRLPRLRRG